MRAFFCLSAGLAVCAMGSLAIADEKPTPQLCEQGIEVTPKKIAGIDRNFHRTTPWIEYNGGNSWPGECDQDLAFDCYEPDEEGYPVDNDPGCGMGSSRWYHGSTYCNMFITNDMETENTTTSDALTVGYAWFWYVEGEGTSEDCYVAVFTAEDFDDSCAGPAAANYYDGVIIGYGVLDSGADAGYYISNVDLCDEGLALTLPADGAGAYEMILANDYDDTYIYMATCAQFMLWGTDENRAGYQGPIQWDDINPIDGQHTAPDECYDFSGLVSCPDPLGAMFYVTGDVGPGTCLDLSIDGNYAGSPIDIELCNLTPHGTGAVLYSFSLGRFVWSSGDWCVDFGLHFNGPQDASDHMVFQGTDSDGDGCISDTVPVPCAAGGITVHFQGAEKYTCPYPCMSNIVSVTFVPC